MLNINFNNLFNGNLIKKTLSALSVVFFAMLIGAMGASQAQAAPGVAPAFISSTAVSFAENATGTIIEVNAQVGGVSKALTYSIIPFSVDGTSYDASLFSIAAGGFGHHK